MGLNELVAELEKVMRKSKVNKLVEERVKEFLETNNADNERWFEELIFCILTANSSAITGLKAVEKLKEKNLLLKGSTGEVEKALREVGHRYAKRRAEYIILARKYSSNLKDILTSIESIYRKREWLAKNIKGIGMKEASHFLRNVGYFNLAIIDRHIIKILKAYNLVNPTLDRKTITKKKYIKIEKLIKRIARKLNIKPGILDLYLWYMSTGKILK